MSKTRKKKLNLYLHLIEEYTFSFQYPDGIYCNNNKNNVLDFQSTGKYITE